MKAPGHCVRRMYRGCSRECARDVPGTEGHVLQGASLGHFFCIPGHDAVWLC